MWKYRLENHLKDTGEQTQVYIFISIFGWNPNLFYLHWKQLPFSVVKQKSQYFFRKRASQHVQKKTNTRNRISWWDYENTALQKHFVGTLFWKHRQIKVHEDRIALFYCTSLDSSSSKKASKTYYVKEILSIIYSIKTNPALDTKNEKSLKNIARWIVQHIYGKEN